MDTLNTDYFSRCIATLNRAFEGLQQQSQESEMYDIYRAACVKEFEIILEQAGKLLKKCLKPYFASRSLSDLSNRNEPNGRASAYFLNFEAHS